LGSDVKKSLVISLGISEASQQASVVPSWKRVLDLVCLVLALPFVAPLFLAIAAYIKLVSPGPVFFLQDRVGLRGTTFRCFKFRSMKPNSDTGAHKAYLQQLMRSDRPMVKLDAKGDCRLIPGARLLRATGLDELPQLINVWRGQMSLVGPRPCTPYELEGYLPWQRERFQTLPGLTGLWQVSGKNRTTFNQMIQLDVEYVRRKSVALDLSIMARTPMALVQQVLETRQARRQQPTEQIVFAK
jgi:lipopolysaccharide/colanic/teichoic acid biosynthesis glycosyltransferase